MNVSSSETYSINRLVELLGGEVVYVPKRRVSQTAPLLMFKKSNSCLKDGKNDFEEGVALMLEIDYWREAPVWDPSSIELRRRTGLNI